MIPSSTGVKVLFAGQYWPGSNSMYIARAFERCGAIVHILNDTTIHPDWTSTRGRIARRLLRKTVIETEWNQQLLWWAERFQPDCIYITSADYCWPATLESLQRRSIPIVCFYHDVQWKDRLGSRFSQNIGHFDLVATTRSWQEPEFKAAGAQDIMIIRFGFEPSVHRPLELEPKAIDRYGTDATFIGTYEPHRAAELESLVSTAFPYHFRLWGGYWERLAEDSVLRKFWQKHLIQESEIPVIYAASRIALHWVGWEPFGTDPALKKGDQHNSRTFQIAACGGAIMLAQRTSEHLQYFTEDKEAVYFDDVDELRRKLAYWLHPEKEADRRQIAIAARERCLSEDYSYLPIAKRILAHLGFPTR